MMPFTKNLCNETWPPFSLSVFTVSMSVVLCLITLPGNLLLCIAILKDPYKELKNSFNCFVLQLALSDLLVGALTEPLFIMFHIREAMGYPVIRYIWVIHLSFFIPYTASILSLAALMLDRYLTVMSYYKRILSTNTVILISVLIWVISITLPCFYFMTGFYLFAFMFTNAALIVIISILTFSYLRIHQRLKAQISRWNWLHQTQVKLDAMSMERKLNRAFYTILAIFVACLFPSLVMIYVISFCDTCHCKFIHWLRDLQFLLPLVNCSLNQFLYAWKSRNFRRAISAVLCKTVSYEVQVNVPALSPNGIVSIRSTRSGEMELIPLDPAKLLTKATVELGEVNEDAENFPVIED